MSESCPCCSGKQYSLCCQPFVKGTEIPLSAEQLMRSRYCAYVKQDVDYLVATWHPTSRVPALADLVTESFAGTEWLSLNITRCDEGRHKDESFVTFLHVLLKTVLIGRCTSVHAFFARTVAGTMSTE